MKLGANLDIAWKEIILGKNIYIFGNSFLDFKCIYNIYCITTE